MAEDLATHGKAKIHGFGRFEVSRRTGKILFEPYQPLVDRMGGDVRDGGGVSEDCENDDDDYDLDGGRDSDDDDNDGDDQNNSASIFR